MSCKAVSLVLCALGKKDRLQTGETYYHNGAEKVIENINTKTLWNFADTLPEM